MTDPVDGEEEEEVGLTKPANTIFDGIQINFGSWPFKQHGSTIMLWGIKLVLFLFLFIFPFVFLLKNFY